jgi:integrase
MIPQKMDLNHVIVEPEDTAAFKKDMSEEKAKIEFKTTNYIAETFKTENRVLAPFALKHRSIRAVAKYCLVCGIGSKDILRMHIRSIYNFCKIIGKDPDAILAQCVDAKGNPKRREINNVNFIIIDYINCLRAKGMANATASNIKYSLDLFFRINNIEIKIPLHIKRTPEHYYRAPTIEEIQKILSIANVREKAIIAMLALGGFRCSTLAQLKYKHVKHDIEQNIIPVHVNIEWKITKGQRWGYCTFLGKEAVDYLTDYLKKRMLGTRRIPPELIDDESPLIREVTAKIKSASPRAIYYTVHQLFFRAGILQNSHRNQRYELCAHSFRKFFFTEFSLAGVNRNCIEYFLCHKDDSYSNVQSKGIDYLRNVYLTAGISLLPKTKESKIKDLLELIRRWGLEPGEIIKEEVLRGITKAQIKK